MSVNAIGTQNEQKYKKPGFWRSAGGVAAGIGASAAIKVADNFVNSKIMNKMENLNKLTPDEGSLISKYANDALSSSGLAEKGIKIVNVNAENQKEIEKLILEDTNSRAIGSFFGKYRKKIDAKVNAELIAEGENAMCLFKLKKILMPQEGMELSKFHELGHTAMYNLTKVGKIIQHCSDFAPLTIPAMTLIALLKGPKAPGEKSKNKIDKATDFIKNNAGKLIFLAGVPTLVNEAAASIKGVKLAKAANVSPELIAKMNKSNVYGFATYALGAVMAAVGTAVAVKVRDSIAKPKQIEAK